eukprot:Nitzschia sp. Nitz4//scaffold359_size15291//8648//10527//NITZ4_008885-RA/size15291-snap-gene-0.12-mRNA-1//1//CDS//3329549024//8794//frame0
MVIGLRGSQATIRLSRFLSMWRRLTVTRSHAVSSSVLQGVAVGHARVRSLASNVPGVIYDPPSYRLENQELASWIRCGITGVAEEALESSGSNSTSGSTDGESVSGDYSRDTGMSLLFLGTSAGIPTKTRSTTSTLLRLGGESFLFDAGEGVQRQLAFTRGKLTHIDRIFITHLHGDHIFGLPGILLGLQHAIQAMKHDSKPNSRKNKNQNQSTPHTVKIYGPPGLYNYVAACITLSCTVFHSVHVEVHELVGGRVRRTHGTSNTRNPFEADYPEFQFGFLTRHTIPCENGVWTIHDFPEQISRAEVMSNRRRKATADKDRRVRVHAAEVDHLSGVVTFGYVVQEDEPARNIDAPKALSLGVSPKGKKYELLKHGFSVQTDDGARLVKPEEVWKPRTKKSRKVSIVGDNRGWTQELVDLAKDSDVLIHEATLTRGKDWVRGHSTPAMAGERAQACNAAVLILNHISSKSDRVDENGESQQLDLIRRARGGSNHSSDVLVAYDFMELLLPWMGFSELGTSDTNNSNDRTETDDSPTMQTAEESSSSLVEATGTTKGREGKAEELGPTSQVLEKWFGGVDDGVAKRK